MKNLFLMAVLTCPLFFFTASSQKKVANANRELANQLFSQANKLNSCNNPDSITRSYHLLDRVLALDEKFSLAYESKICIDYKRGRFNNALEIAQKYTRAMPGWGNSWAYLGVVQRKLNDSISANRSFFIALEKYRAEAEVWKKDKHASDIVQAKVSIVKGFLGEQASLFTSTKKKSLLKTSTIDMSIKELEDVDSFIDRYMSYNSIQFL